MLSDIQRQVTLKDGTSVLVSRYRVEDLEELLNMYASLSDKALRWAAPPYNREQVLRMVRDPDKNIVLVARLRDGIVGHCIVGLSQGVRFRGVSSSAMYLHQDYQNRGLGTAMLAMAVQLAREMGLHRIGLRVVADNHRAIHVYEKVGFRIEGTQREAYYGEDQQYHDIVEMGLLLGRITPDTRPGWGTAASVGFPPQEKGYEIFVTYRKVSTATRVALRNASFRLSQTSWSRLSMSWVSLSLTYSKA